MRRLALEGCLTPVDGLSNFDTLQNGKRRQVSLETYSALKGIRIDIYQYVMARH